MHNLLPRAVPKYNNKIALIQRVVSIWFIVCGLLLCVALAMDDQFNWLSLIPFCGMLFVWGVVLSRLSLADEAKVGNPLFIIIVWSFLYFIIPSIMFLLGMNIPFSHFIGYSVWERIQYLHIVFMLGITGGYYAVKGKNRVEYQGSRYSLPNGWLLVTITLLPLAVNVVARVVSGQEILTDITYGESWYSLHESGQRSQSLGGSTYIVSQIASKLWFYPIIAQGVGLGVCGSYILKRYSRIWPILLMWISIIGINLIVGGRTRSSSIVVILIAIVIQEIIGPPIPLRYVGLFAVTSLVAMDVYSVLRGYPYREYYDVLPNVISDYLYLDVRRFGEFSVMLSKEAYMYSIAMSTRQYEPGLLLSHLITVIPSQLNPMKLDYYPTNQLLSQAFLGHSTSMGAGVAGTIVGDGIRIGGWIGVAITAIMVGVLCGSLERIMKKWASFGGGFGFWVLCAWAGWIGWSFSILRSDMGSFINSILYYFTLPIIVGYVLNMWSYKIQRMNN